MSVSKVKLISTATSMIPPAIGEEIEPHLTLYSSGKVKMNCFNSSGGYSDFTMGRKEEILIEASLAKDILNLISKCMREGLGSIYCTDSGSWKMTVFNSDKNNDRYDGSLTGGLVIDNEDLTDYIQKYIPIDSLFVFGDTFE